MTSQIDNLPAAARGQASRTGRDAAGGGGQGFGDALTDLGTSTEAASTDAGGLAATLPPPVGPIATAPTVATASTAAFLSTTLPAAVTRDRQDVAPTPGATSSQLLDALFNRASAKPGDSTGDTKDAGTSSPDTTQDPSAAVPVDVVAQAAGLIPVAAALAPQTARAPALVASPTGAQPPLAAAPDAGLATASTRITGVKVETHLAPVDLSQKDTKAEADAPLPFTVGDPPAQAIALPVAMSAPTRSVTQAVATLTQQVSAAVAPDPTTAPPPAPPRTMTLQLSPADLGTVDIRLHLSGDSLDLQLSVSNKETLGAISRDRAHLETAINAQNYELRSLVIQGADASGAAANGNSDGARGQSPSGQQQQQSGQGLGQDQGASTSTGGGAGGRGAGRDAPQDQRISSHEAALAPAAARAAGALFV